MEIPIIHLTGPVHSSPAAVPAAQLLPDFAMSTSISNVKIESITGNAGSVTQFKLRANSSEVTELVSSDTLITLALLPALLTGAAVEIIVFDESNVIQRVFAYERGTEPKTPLFGKYQVNRIATQGKSDGSDQHLEAFANSAPATNDKAYNAYDGSIQAILVAAFQTASPVDLTMDPGNIITRAKLSIMPTVP